eukprot:4030166-Alexandrium_andersonii.AAC.1
MLRAGNELGYWRYRTTAYAFSSSLTVPHGEWVMVCASTTPTASILYLCRETGITSATTAFTYPSRTFPV